jgi:hypothetical protein
VQGITAVDPPRVNVELPVYPNKRGLSDYEQWRREQASGHFARTNPGIDVYRARFASTAPVPGSSSTKPAQRGLEPLAHTRSFRVTRLDKMNIAYNRNRDRFTNAKEYRNKIDFLPVRATTAL